MLYNRNATPRRWALRRQLVANATSRRTGSSTQALVRSVSVMPNQLTGHWRRESAARGRGASKQSQVQNNSYANIARRSSHPKHPTTLGMASLLVRTAAEGPLSVRRNIFATDNNHKPHQSVMAISSLPGAAIATTIVKPLTTKASKQPTAANIWPVQHTWGGRSLNPSKRSPPAASNSRPKPAQTFPTIGIATTSRSQRLVRTTHLGWPKHQPKQAQPTSSQQQPAEASPKPFRQ